MNNKNLNSVVPNNTKNPIKTKYSLCPADSIRIGHMLFNMKIVEYGDRNDYIMERKPLELITFSSEEFKKFASLLKEMVDSPFDGKLVRYNQFELRKYDFRPKSILEEYMDEKYPKPGFHDPRVWKEDYISIGLDNGEYTDLPKSAIYKLYEKVMGEDID